MERMRTNWRLDLYRCEMCGHTQRKRTNFCPHCGRQARGGPLENVVEIEWLEVDDDDPVAYDCSNCGAMVSKQFNYCPRCGGVWKH